MPKFVKKITRLMVTALGLIAATMTGCTKEKRSTDDVSTVVHAIDEIVHRNLASGKMPRQSCVDWKASAETNHWLFDAGEENKRIGLSFAMEEDIGCGCCFSEVRTEVSDDDLGEVVKLKGLRQLVLKRTEVSDAGIHQLIQLPDLEVLDLSDTGVTDAAMSSISRINSLRELNLERTQITDVGLQQLRTLSSLTKLSFGGTRCTGEGLAALGDLPNLEFCNGGPKTTKALDAYLSLPAIRSIWIPPDLSGFEQSTRSIHVADLQDLESLRIGKLPLPSKYILENLPKLKFLAIANVSQLDLQALDKLERVELSGAITLPIIKQLMKSESIQSLDLRFGEGSDATVVEQLDAFADLKQLRITADSLPPDALSKLQLPSSIRQLAIFGGSFSAQAAERLEREWYDQLRSLVFSRTAFPDGLDLNLRNSIRFEELSITQGTIERIKISNASRLKRLWLGHGIKIGELELKNTGSMNLTAIHHLSKRTRGEDREIEKIRILDFRGDWLLEIRDGVPVAPSSDQ